VNVETSEVYAGFAAAPAEVDPDAPKFDPADAPKGSGAETFVIDARATLGIPWEPGRYLATLIMRDVVSNRAPLVLAKSTATYRDEEVEKYLAQRRAKAPLPRVWPPLPELPRVPAGATQPPPDAPHPLPSYSIRPGSPELPEAPGIALAVKRVVEVNAPGGCVVRGSFKLPAKWATAVPPPVAPSAPGTQEQPTAIVPITLLLTGSKQPDARSFALKVPVYTPIDFADEAAQATGYFAFDLCKYAPVNRVPQTFFVYAFSGELMVGPALMAFAPVD
jgi:hypothetical protein